MANIMNAKDAVAASLAECYVTIDGNRYNFMQAINLEASIEKTKTEVPILGKTGKGNSRITRLAYEASYNILVEKLNALEWVDGDERHAELFTWWNARIDHYRAMTSNNLRP